MNECAGVIRGTHLVVLAVLFEELFAEGVFDRGGFVGFAKGGEVGVGWKSGEGGAEVCADALGAAHSGHLRWGRGGKGLWLYLESLFASASSLRSPCPLVEGLIDNVF